MFFSIPGTKFRYFLLPCPGTGAGARTFWDGILAQLNVLSLVFGLGGADTALAIPTALNIDIGGAPGGGGGPPMPGGGGGGGGPPPPIPGGGGGGGTPPIPGGGGGGGGAPPIPGGGGGGGIPPTGGIGGPPGIPGGGGGGGGGAPPIPGGGGGAGGGADIVIEASPFPTISSDWISVCIAASTLDRFCTLTWLVILLLLILMAFKSSLKPLSNKLLISSGLSNAIAWFTILSAKSQ